METNRGGQEKRAALPQTDCRDNANDKCDSNVRDNNSDMSVDMEQKK